MLIFPSGSFQILRWTLCFPLHIFFCCYWSSWRVIMLVRTFSKSSRCKFHPNDFMTVNFVCSASVRFIWYLVNCTDAKHISSVYEACVASEPITWSSNQTKLTPSLYQNDEIKEHFWLASGSLPPPPKYEVVWYRSHFCDIISCPSNDFISFSCFFSNVKIIVDILIIFMFVAIDIHVKCWQGIIHTNGILIELVSKYSRC